MFQQISTAWENKKGSSTGCWNRSCSFLFFLVIVLTANEAVTLPQRLSDTSKTEAAAITPGRAGTLRSGHVLLVKPKETE